MIYLVNNIDQIPHLFNKYKRLIFVYNNERMKYFMIKKLRELV